LRNFKRDLPGPPGQRITSTASDEGPSDPPVLAPFTVWSPPSSMLWRVYG
jgi:hypothetical protein